MPIRDGLVLMTWLGERERERESDDVTISNDVIVDLFAQRWR